MKKTNGDDLEEAKALLLEAIDRQPFEALAEALDTIIDKGGDGLSLARTHTLTTHVEASSPRLRFKVLPYASSTRFSVTGVRAGKREKIIFEATTTNNPDGAPAKIDILYRDLVHFRESTAFLNDLLTMMAFGRLEPETFDLTADELPDGWGSW